MIKTLNSTDVYLAFLDYKRICVLSDQEIPEFEEYRLWALQWFAVDNPDGYDGDNPYAIPTSFVGVADDRHDHTLS